MAVTYSKTFIKQAKKLHPKLRKKLQQKIELFMSDPLDPTLRNHALRGKYKQYRSIDITGDVRALYLQKDDEAIFDAVGTHSQLYS
jgi:YafQ family addiction module toxin component